MFILLHDQIIYRRPFVSVFVENTGFSLWIGPLSIAWNYRVDTILKTLETFENAIFMNSVSDTGNCPSYLLLISMASKRITFLPQFFQTK